MVLAGQANGMDYACLPTSLACVPAWRHVAAATCLGGMPRKGATATSAMGCWRGLAKTWRQLQLQAPASPDVEPDGEGQTQNTGGETEGQERSEKPKGSTGTAENAAALANALILLKNQGMPEQALIQLNQARSPLFEPHATSPQEQQDEEHTWAKRMHNAYEKTSPLANQARPPQRGAEKNKPPGRGCRQTHRILSEASAGGNGPRSQLAGIPEVRGHRLGTRQQSTQRGRRGGGFHHGRGLHEHRQKQCRHVLHPLPAPSRSFPDHAGLPFRCARQCECATQRSGGVGNGAAPQRERGFRAGCPSECSTIANESHEWRTNGRHRSCPGRILNKCVGLLVRSTGEGSNRKASLMIAANRI